MSTLLRAPVFLPLRHGVRKWSDDHVSRPVARALRVAPTLRRKETKAVHLGDSSMIHIAPYDSDRRRLGEMLSDALEVGVAQFYGPGYSPALFAEFVRLVDLSRVRCVVISLAPRAGTHLHVIKHPIFGYAPAIDALRGADRLGPRTARHVLKPAPTEEDYKRFESQSRESRWQMDDTIGAYRRRLRGYDLLNASTEDQRLLFDYFHGESNVESPELASWRLLGERLKALDVAVLAYRTYMPLEKGVSLFGPEFREHVEKNFVAVEDALFAGLGRRSLVEVSPPPDDAYIWPSDGTEHWNQGGRRSVVEAIQPTVMSAIAAR